MNRIQELIKELCPNGVEWKKLGEIFTFRNGYTPSTTNESFWNGGTIPWFKMEDLRDNGKILKDSNLHITPIAVKGDRLFKANSILIATSATIGEHALILVEHLSNQRFTNIYPRDIYESMIDMHYINHYMPIIDEWCKKNVKLGNFASVDMDKLKNYPIPLPPLPVQTEIVRILDKFVEQQEQLEKLIELRTKQYEYYREEMLKNVNGENGKLIDLLIQPITDGPHVTPKFVDEGIPFISATAIYEGRVHLQDAQGFISKEFDNEISKKYKPRKFDVYMVKSGSTTGKVGIVDTDDDFNVWSPLAAMRTQTEVQARYLYHLLQTSYIQDQVLLGMSQGSQPNLSMRTLEQFNVTIPTFKEQERIVSVLQRIENYIFLMTSALEASKKRYEHYRDEMLRF